MIKKLLNRTGICRRKVEGSRLINIWNLIDDFLLYISKAFLLMIITCVALTAIWSVSTYVSHHGDLGGSFGEIINLCLINMVVISLLNIRIFLALFFYRFNNVEIISETCLFIFMYVSGTITDYDFVSSWPIILLMLLYMAVKKTIIRHACR